MFRWFTGSLRPYVVRFVHINIANNYELDIGSYIVLISYVTEQQFHMGIHNKSKRKSWGLLNVLNSTVYSLHLKENN